MGKRETPIQRDILLASAGLGFRLFRNNVGFDDSRKVRYGLQAGSGDLIGWFSTPAGVLAPETQVAVFASVEVKPPGEKAKRHQERWAEAVRAAGGIAVVAHEPADLERAIEEWMRE